MKWQRGRDGSVDNLFLKFFLKNGLGHSAEEVKQFEAEQNAERLRLKALLIQQKTQEAIMLARQANVETEQLKKKGSKKAAAVMSEEEEEGVVGGGEDEAEPEADMDEAPREKEKSKKKKKRAESEEESEPGDGV